MPYVFKRFADISLKLYGYLGLIALAGVVITTFLQVVTRFFPIVTLTWTEEAARYCFIWMSMMGAPLAARHCSNAAVDLLDTLIDSPGMKEIYFVVVHALILIAVFLILPKSIYMVQTMTMRNSSALGIPMSYIYLSIPIGCIGIIIQDTYNILAKVAKE